MLMNAENIKSKDNSAQCFNQKPSSPRLLIQIEFFFCIQLKSKVKKLICLPRCCYLCSAQFIYYNIHILYEVTPHLIFSTFHQNTPLELPDTITSLFLLSRVRVILQQLGALLKAEWMALVVVSIAQALSLPTLSQPTQGNLWTSFSA